MLTLGKWWVVQCDNRSYTVGREWEKKSFSLSGAAVGLAVTLGCSAVFTILIKTLG